MVTKIDKKHFEFVPAAENSPELKGNPKAKTQAAGDNSTNIATTAYVDAKVSESITDGITGIAPSQDAVSDALKLKSDIILLNKEKELLTNEINSLKKSVIENSNDPQLTTNDYGSVSLPSNCAGVGTVQINGITLDNIADGDFETTGGNAVVTGTYSADRAISGSQSAKLVEATDNCTIDLTPFNFTDGDVIACSGCTYRHDTVAVGEGSGTPEEGDPIPEGDDEPEIPWGDEPIPESFHQITTAQELKDFRDLVNSGSTTECAILMADIDLAGNSSDQWIPIGNSTSYKYNGIFDGNNHTVSGIYIDTTSAAAVMYQGFIGISESYAVIKNLTVDGTIILKSTDSRCGGIVGYTPSYSHIFSCKNKINVSGNGGSYLGGIVGYNYKAYITNCINEGNVSGGSYVGGISGYDYESGYLKNNANSGTIIGTSNVGGILGYLRDYTNVQGNTNSGSVTGTSSVGGIIGFCLKTSKIKFKRNINSGVISGSSLTGSLIGNINNTGSAFSELLFSEINDAGLIFLDNYYTETSCACGIGLPLVTEDLLHVIRIAGSDVSEVPEITTYEITTAQELKDFRDLTNIGYTYINAKLMNDIDLAGNDSDQWNPIANYNLSQTPEYTGIFDGNGYKISGLYINRSFVSDYSVDNCAFIGQLADEGIVKNLTLEGYILGGSWSVAGFVGELWGGKIINCINKVIITGPEDGDTMGGLAGFCGWANSLPTTHSEIINCTNDANVGIEIGSGSFGGIIGAGSGCNIKNCINKGNVFGGGYAMAGIAGDFQQGIISNCVNEGNVTGTDEDVSGIANYLSEDDIISNCVNKGIITGINHVSGIVSNHNTFTTIINCVNEGTINCEGNSCGAIVNELKLEIINKIYDDNFSASFTINDGNIDMGTVYPNYKHYYTDAEPVGTVHEIYTAQDLKDFRDLVNAGSTTESAILMNNITLNEHIATQDPEVWVSIGNINNEYNGTFDGNGFAINGVYIGYYTPYNIDGAGFISYANENAVIKNLYVSGSICSSKGSVGGIVGIGTSCKIINCINDITISVSSSASSTVYDIGGVIGLLHKSSNENKIPLILNCTNRGEIYAGNPYGLSDRVGGIVGKYSSEDSILDIINCINEGYLKCNDCIGGIIGTGFVNVHNCYNCGNIEATAMSSSSGGIAYSVNNVYNCCNNGSIKGSKYIGGITATSSNTINCINNGYIEFISENAGIEWGYGEISGYIEENTLSVNNYYPEDGYNCGRAYTDLSDLSGVNNINGIATTYVIDYSPVCTCLITNIYDYNIIYDNYKILPINNDHNYNTDITNVDITGVSIIKDLSQININNTYYLDTSCSAATVDANMNYEIITTMNDVFETYTEGNAPAVAALINGMVMSSSPVTISIYPYHNSEISTVVYSDWVLSNSSISNVSSNVLNLTGPGKTNVSFDVSFTLINSSLDMGTVEIINKSLFSTLVGGAVTDENSGSIGFRWQDTPEWFPKDADEWSRNIFIRTYLASATDNTCSFYPSLNSTVYLDGVTLINLTTHGLSELSASKLADVLSSYFDGVKTFNGVGCLISKDSESNEVGRMYFSTTPMYSNSTLSDVLIYSNGEYFHTHNVDSSGVAIETPYNTKVSTTGNVITLSGGTVTYEPWYYFISVYTDKFTIDKYITDIKELHKYGSETPIIDAVIAENGFDLTSASLQAGDLVYGVFEIDEPLRPLLIIKSRNVITPTVAVDTDYTPNSYYGTDELGRLGFWALPTGTVSGGGSIDENEEDWLNDGSLNFFDLP